MRIVTGFCLFSVLFALSAAAQTGRALWSTPIQADGQAARQEPWVQPAAGSVYSLDEAGMAALLQAAPPEFSRDAAQNPFHMVLPLPDGGFAEFAIVEASIMHPDLAAKYPGIRTFRGNGVDVPAATARLDITPQGFHAQILSPGGAVYIDPQVRSRETYVSYYHRNAEQKNHQCLLEDAFATPRPKQDENRAERAIGDTLRTYRLAVTAQGEYTVFHGGAAQAMAAIVTTINRVNGIYETELSVRLELVANNNLLIYTDPATDPYSVNDSSGTTLDENQTNTDAVIGNSDYDVGHIFNTGGGGLASLGVICFNSQKAEGATGRANPVGDAFDVDFVAHELGHQFGADHSFNGVTSSCSNRNSPTAYEPGSGVTIMGYAGICGADDLANNSIPYFNSGSFDQIIAYLDSESCESGTATGNNAPTVSAGSSMTIPALTPFTLTATGSDPDGHAVTYSWEQRDLGPAKLVTNGDDGSGPLFRPWTPTTSPSRTCPRLSDLLANTTVIGESLPATTRTLSFRVTARDNQAGGGGVNTAEVTHNVVATGTAFAVTSPNTAVSWSGAQTVTWDVAGTTANGINAANVDILLSIDGGSSYGMTLASNTPNDGSEAVSIPNLNSTAARIKVQPVGNIFFDISNANFTITPLTDVAFSAGTPTVDDSAGNGNGSVDPGESISLDVLVSNTGTANTGPITATLSSLSGSVTVTAANSAYPGLIGGGPASVNLTPFSIDVGAGHPCGSPVNLRLSLVSAELTETVDLSIDVGVIAGAPDVRPFVVSSNLIDGGTAQVSFDIAGFSGAVADVDFRFDGITCGAAEAATTNGLNHTWISDLTISLISPSGTSVELFRQRTGDFNHMCDLTFDDSATNPISAIPSVSPLTGNFQPEAPLSAFNGENPNGTWRIEISDAFTPDSGTVTGFSLLLTGRECTEADPPALTSFARQTPAIRNTNADTLVFRASFDEDVQGVNAADFAVTGTTATIADVSAVSASVYDITVSGGDLAGLSATVQLDLAGGQNITDLAGNRLPTAEPGTDEDYNVSNSLGPNPRIVRVDPTADMVTLKNFGDASIDLTGYFFCSTFRYPSVSHGILAAGASVTLPFTHGSGMDANADLGLYMNNAGFADPANMVDFVQFGSASHPRETVAVTKGIWSAGDFIASGASYRYIGDGSQYGVAFWATPAISFAQSGGTTDISEDGATDSVDVALTIIPDGTVNLTLSADAQSELSTDGANFSASVSFSLIDTSAQTITVRAINDPTVEGTHTSSITVSVTNNADIDFPASGPSPAFSAAVTDNDAPDFSISESGGNTSVSEAGTTDSFTVVLDARPTSDVVLTVSSSDTGEATVDKANLTFETGNWDTAQTVTVTGVDDPSADGGQTTTITLAVDDANSDDSFDSLADQTVSVTTTDDDVAALILTIAASSISEAAGPAATTATVSRNSDTTNALTVTLSSSDTGEAGVTATVTIPAGQSSSAPFDIDAIDDLLIDGTQTVTITATATAHADGTDTVDVTDDDVAALTVAIVAASISEADGPAATTATVSRNSDTTNALTVTLGSSDTGEADVAATVTISAGQSSSAPFDIDAIDDLLIDGTQTVTVTATATAHADGTDTVDVTDDDVAALTAAIVAASISEAAGPAATTATVSRNSDTTNALTVALSSSDTGEADVAATVTISAGQSSSAPFDIDAIDDLLIDGTQTVTVTATATAHADGTDTVDVTDDDIAALTVAIAAASISEADGPAATTATVSRNSDATNALTVTLSSSDTAEADVNATVTIPAGWTGVTFDIDAVDDALLDATQTVTITATAAAHADGSDSIDVTNDDIAALISFTRQNPAASPTNADILVFRATFDNDVSNVDAGDFAVNGSTTANVTAVSANSASSYDITVSGGDLAGYNGAVGIDLAPAQDIADFLGSALPGGEPTTDETYTVDNIAPTLTSFTRLDANPTSADSLTFRATFDETVTGLDAADFAANGSSAAVTGITGSYDISISGGDLAGLNGSVGLDLAGGQNITDLAGNALPAGEPATDETYTIDNSAPSLSSFTRRTPFNATTNANVLEFRAIFDEDVQSVAAADFVINSTSTAAVAGIVVTTASVYDITVSGGDLAGFDGSIGLDLAGGQDITDLTGNALPAGEPGTDESYIVDNRAPALTGFTRETPATSLTNADILIFRATFDESVINVDTTDFAVAGGSTAGIAAVSANSASSYDVTVSGGDLASFDGTVGLNLAGGQNIADIIGNSLPGGEPATDETYTVDNTAPIADGAGPYVANIAQSITFDASGSSDANGIVLTEWDFDNDGSYDATGTTAPHSYAVDGNRAVRVRVTDNAGNTAFTITTVTINSDPNPVVPGVVDAATDAFVVSRDGSDVVITRGGVEVLRQALASITTLTINGTADDDDCSIDFGGGDPIDGITFTFNGGLGADSLTISGSFTTQIFTYTDSDATGFAGNVDLDSSTVNFTGLAPVTGGNSVNTLINLPAGTANTDAELANSATPGFMEITGSTFEDTSFPNPTGSLVITINHSADLLTVSGFDPAFAVPLTIQGIGSATMTATDVTWTGTVGIAGTFTAAPATGTLTLSGLITGGSTFSKSGAGTAIITAGNNYTGSGTTAVLAGTLLITNPSGSATGNTNVSVSSGANFGGSGSILGGLSVDGSVAPGE